MRRGHCPARGRLAPPFRARGRLAPPFRARGGVSHRPSVAHVALGRVLVDGAGERDVLRGQRRDAGREHDDLDAGVGDVKLGVVVHALAEQCDAADEAEDLVEVGEVVRPVNGVAVIDLGPIVNFAERQAARSS